MSELLNLIERGQARDSQEARQRESTFTQQRNQQQTLLNRARSDRTRQENESARLEQLFENNNTRIVAARAALDERLGALKELFGVLQTVSGDTQGRFNASLTNLQYPDREEFLVALGSKMASATELAQIEDIERLWFELQREIYESGKVVRFNHQVTTAAGEQIEAEIVRVGNLNRDSQVPRQICLMQIPERLASVSTERVVAFLHCSLRPLRSWKKLIRAASLVTALFLSVCSVC
jgi:biopolymer transport protein ExbB